METLRYKATIAYDGTHFSGFQIQPDERTVQNEVELALKTINKGNFIRIYPAGRTDAGVHAWGMVLHFDFPDTIPTDGLMRALNVLTPDDIIVRKLERTSKDFHARFCAKVKMYTYRIDNNRLANPFTRHYVLHHPYTMNEERVKKALAPLVGTHDFTSFCSVHTDKEDKRRTIYEASLKVDEETNEWLFAFRGDGFLYNMIRIIMGTILPIADGRSDVSTMKNALEAKDRTQAGHTISPKGLRLEWVDYD